MFTVDDVGAEAEQVVDISVNLGLIARDRLCRQHHRVALSDLNVPKSPRGHAGERGVWLPLGAGRQHTDLVVRESTDLLKSHSVFIGKVQIAKFLCDGHVLLHAPSRDSHFAADTGRRLNHELSARVQRGKGSYDDAARGAGKDVLKCLGQLPLGGRVARRLCVGAVGH